MGEAAHRRMLAHAGKSYGERLAELTIETFGVSISPETADAVAATLRSDILERGAELMDGGVPIDVAIVWGNACIMGLRQVLGRQVQYARALAALSDLDPAKSTRQ